MMEQKTIVEITEYAKALMSRAEISMILQLSEEDIESDEFDKAYMSGFLQTKFLVQQSIVNLAASGSSPAQSISNKLILDIEGKEAING